MPEEFLDALIEQYRAGEVELTGSGGFIGSLIKAVLERGLQAELADHLGYDKHDRAGHGSGNSRNGSTSKTLSSEVGPVELDTPRDRAGTFTPQLVPKGERHLGSGLSDMIISLYAGGMTVRDIQAHLARTLQVELSHETIANITDAVLDEVYAWQTRPLEPVYPIVYLDAIVVKVKENNQVRNKSAHIVIGVDLDGAKTVLGIWVQNTEGAKFWAGVCAELRNRGVQDILIACCDGLKGLPEAIEATWPQTTVQTCVVHLIRASMRFVSYTDRKAVARLLKPVYTAATLTDADTAMVAFAESDMGRKYPSAVKTWLDAWERFIPFLEFPPEVTQGDLHDELDRVVELRDPQDHQEPGALPERHRGGQTDLAGHPRHRGQGRAPAGQGTRQTRTRTHRRRQTTRHHRPRLETSPEPARRRLPRPHPRQLETEKPPSYLHRRLDNLALRATTGAGCQS